MIDEARVKRMIDVADELIEELADRGFDAAESGVVLSLAAIQTAKALGLTVSPTLLAIADDMIE